MNVSSLILVQRSWFQDTADETNSGIANGKGCSLKKMTTCMDNHAPFIPERNGVTSLPFRTLP